MSSELQKPKKSAGIIRWNGIIPFVVICLLVYSYFILFFDTHMRKAIEWGGYKAMGVEVNIDKFTSDLKAGKIQVNRIQITNRDNPNFNSIELSDFNFDINVDALLRLKYVVEQLDVTGIQFMSKRDYPGKVEPEQPPSGPSITEQLKARALNKLESENAGNILGDIASFLKTGQFEEQLKGLESKIQSKVLIQSLNTKWNDKKTTWDQTIKELPNSEDLKRITDDFNKIKYKDFANLQELEASVKQFKGLSDELNTKKQQIVDTKTKLDTDLKDLDTDYKKIDSQIKQDIDTIKSYFKIPKIDASQFAKSLFMEYLIPITQKADRFKDLAKSYLPSKYARMLDGDKASQVVDDNTIQVRPRDVGTDYEFPIANGYPKYWIQTINISSKSNSQTDYGDFTGVINDITSNQRQIGKPTKASINGSFNKLNFQDISLNALLNNISESSLVKLDFGIGSYPIKDLKLIESAEGKIELPLSQSSFSAKAEIIDFQKYDLALKNIFNNVNFKIASDNAIIQEVLNGTLGPINTFDLNVTAKGEIKNLDIDISSSLGPALETGFKNLLQAKIKEANDKLQAAINKEVDKLKAEFNKHVDALKLQTQGEVNKLQSQYDDKKKEVDTRVEQAKKDFQDKVDKAKKEAEDKVKNKVNEEAGKQLDDIKKKLGW